LSDDSRPTGSPTLKPEIEPGNYVRIGNGKAVWKVGSRTKVHATLKEIWIGTMRYHVGMAQLTKVNKDGTTVREAAQPITADTEGAH
jgi:hypothetical protein